MYLICIGIGLTIGIALDELLAKRVWKFLEFREKLRIGLARIQREAAKAELRSQQIALMTQNTRQAERWSRERSEP